ncbi:MAG: LrgB family protein [Phycisphaerae bacterium]
MIDNIWLPLTLAVYIGAVELRVVIRTPVWNPTLIAIAILGGLLLATHQPYAQYAHGTHILDRMLPVSVVALALPLYREREILFRNGAILIVAIVAGTLSAIAAGWAVAQLLHWPADWSLAMASRTATSPIAIALATELHGAAGLSAVVTIITGIIGAVLGPGWLTIIRIKHPIARGVAMGVTSSAIGTARSLEENQTAGAAASLGMGLGGILVAIILPLLLHYA